MKKLSYICLAFVAAFGLAACSDDYTDWAQQKGSEAEEAVTIDGFQASAVGTIDLNTPGATRTLLTLSNDGLSEGYSVQSVSVVLTPASEGALSTDEQTLTLDQNCQIDSATVQSAVTAAYGANPVARQFKAKVTADVSNGSNNVLVDAGTIDLYATPAAPTISTVGYYIVGNFSTSHSWDANYTDYKYEFNGADPYQNPVITITIPANDLSYGDHLEFKVLDLAHVGSWDAATVLTGDGLTHPTDGTVTGLQDHNAGQNIQFAGTSDLFYRITIDLLNQTASCTTMSYTDYVYEIGNDSGWSTTQWLFAHKTDGQNDGLYLGFLYLNGEYKFRPHANDWEGDWEYVSPGVFGDVAGGPNFPSADEGYYYYTLNVANFTYTVTPGTIGLIGDAVGGWSDDVPMTYNAAEKCFEVTTTFSNAEFKFRANGGWDINWGGDLDNLTQGGSNIKATAGTHTVKLYINADQTAHATFE